MISEQIAKHCWGEFSDQTDGIDVFRPEWCYVGDKNVLDMSLFAKTCEAGYYPFCVMMWDIQWELQNK